MTTVTDTLCRRALVSLSLARCIFWRSALHAGGPLPSLPNPFLWSEGGLWLGCARRVAQGVRGRWCIVARFQFGTTLSAQLGSMF